MRPAVPPAEGGSISDTAAFERALWRLVGRLSHRSVTAWTAQRTGHALPATCWALLEHLHEGGPMRVSDIAACQGVELSSITPRLQILEAEGLVLRRRDARDGRVSFIEIGEKGMEALQGLHQARSELFTSALTSGDMAQLSCVTDVLERISQSLQTRLAAPVAGQGKEAVK